MPRTDRVYDPVTKRTYKKGFSPTEIAHEPIAATCGTCGGPAIIYPAGLACERCCTPATLIRLRNSLGK